MFRWGEVAPIWPPMSRDDQKIDYSFCLAHPCQKVLRALLLQFERNVHYPWLFFGCFPARFIIRKGEKPELFPFRFPDCRFRGQSSGHACTSIMNSSSIQIAHGVQQPFVGKIEHMVIRKRDRINVCSFEGRNVFGIGSKVKHLWGSRPGRSPIGEDTLKITETDVDLLEQR